MTKGLAEGQRLHDTTEIVFVDSSKVKNKSKVESDLYYLVKPTPAFGLQKWQVGLYNNINKKEKEKGLGKWVQKKIGKPPVLYEAATVEWSRQLIEKYLKDNGYFSAVAASKISEKNKKIAVTYEIHSKGQSFIRDVVRPKERLLFNNLFKDNTASSFLRSGKPYRLDDLTAERIRLAQLANDHGYYQINKDDFFYFVDTTAGPLLTDVHLRFRPALDSSRYQIYFINDSWVYPDYSLAANTLTSLEMDTQQYQQLRIVQSTEVLRPTVLSRLIWQDTSQLYSKVFQQNTIKRLLNLGIYKFVNIRLDEQVEKDTYLLDRYIYLTPGLMRDFSVEFQLNSRSGNFLGTEINSSFSHKNAFKGAELFRVNLLTGIETNIGANAANTINTVNVNFEAKLELPGIYAPFIDRKKIEGVYLPRTGFSISDDFQRRTGFYTLNSFNFSTSYNWRKTKWTYEYDPLFVNFINLLESSTALENLLEENQRLRSSFEDVLVLGTAFKYAYSNQTSKERGKYFFYRGSFETAGNLLNLTAGNGGTEETGSVLGIPYSQYFKTDHDFRQYFPLKKGILAGRINIGVGYPYGNATVLPYIKQYFIGGASSIRAFRIRTLGPGGYESKVEDDGSNFVDQTGDVKLEMNLEYRFGIFSYLKGALFVDAGNIWLVNGDADESTPAPDGLFDWNTFYQEIAVGTGFGMRLDFEVAVVRLDWAFPIRKPTQSDGNQWLFSSFDLFDKTWRSENLVWNIAIGYPF